ncbi:unnamed protein product [Nezara viridula]|uniref:Uncharacterized protein n=1 Tax=Nezara viridula TaxID=85310 RepID=A0A9P0H4X4_NEZVI|nr:unnamed protein product [Nezara viridula]
MMRSQKNFWKKGYSKRIIGSPRLQWTDGVSGRRCMVHLRSKKLEGNGREQRSLAVDLARGLDSQLRCNGGRRSL